MKERPSLFCEKNCNADLENEEIFPLVCGMCYHADDVLYDQPFEVTAFGKKFVVWGENGDRYYAENPLGGFISIHKGVCK